MTASVVLVLLCISPVMFCISHRKGCELSSPENASDEILILVGTNNGGTTMFEPPPSVLLDPEFNCDTAKCNTFFNGFVSSIFHKARLIGKVVNTFADSVSQANIFSSKEESA